MLRFALAALWAFTLLAHAEDGTATTVRIEGALGLRQALAFTVQHHPLLQVARQDQRAAGARVLQSDAAFLPKLAAGVYLNAGNTAMIVPGAPAVDPQFWALLPGGGMSLNISLMFPVYTGGRLQARLAQARADERAQIARTALTLRELLRDVRRAFFDVLQAQAAVESAQFNLQEQQELLRLTRERVKIGAQALYVQRRMEAGVASAQQALNTARADERTSRVALNIALGSDVTSEFDLASPDRPVLPATTPENDVEQSLANRPELVVARALLESADESLNQVLASYAPQLSLYAMGEQLRQPAFGSRPLEGGYQVGVVLSWPLFDAERDGRSEEGEALREARGYEIKRLEQQVAGQVLQARARLEAALANEELAAVEQQAAEVELRIARRRFELGRGLYLEVLDALATLTRARQSVIVAQRERGQAEADYLYASGRLE